MLEDILINFSNRERLNGKDCSINALIYELDIYFLFISHTYASYIYPTTHRINITIFSLTQEIYIRSRVYLKYTQNCLENLSVILKIQP
jgi:hypothetical protein